MKSILLAAGYATRLRPLTDHKAKPLLPLAGKPIVEGIYDVLCATGAIDSVHLVTNSRYADDFRRWATRGARPVPVHVHDDGTTTNENRRGAIGDIQFVVEREGWTEEDVLVVAGDNLLGPWMTDFVAFWQAHSRTEPASAIAMYRCPDRELVKQYSVISVDAHQRVQSFVEKPSAPESNLVGIATYAYHRDHVRLIPTYLAEGNSADQPGNFVAWLHRRAAVYGFAFEGDWIDIGNRQQLETADALMRRQAGLPQPPTYDADQYA